MTFQLCFSIIELITQTYLGNKLASKCLRVRKLCKAIQSSGISFMYETLIKHLKLECVRVVNVCFEQKCPQRPQQMPV
ncbi:CLUMA_CG007627, isoform A [Clunio marinus]|uniref:CLUMA_CG007627, isoform A n=1 Tax=Clunio marinus TaxID=568069 RepID=A0A1J1I195_9DIPT|nr:CLUMA_CG007627, isoform A [Clunio marinus]